MAVTEAEWLECEDPRRMLVYVQDRLRTPGQIYVNDRKLRLFACACRRLTNLSWDGASASWQYMEDHPEELAVRAMVPAINYAKLFLKETAADYNLDHSRLAALLRDIVGNPFRPVTLPPGKRLCPQCNGSGCDYKPMDLSGRPCQTCRASGRVSGGPCPWLTPTVLSLAQVAYDERLPEWTWEEYRGGTAGRETRRREVLRPGGTLDPGCLAILSDALEEAGCTDAAILAHLRGEEVCPKCLAGPNRKKCRTMPGGNPDCFEGMVALRGPHVRGCWALDLIFGKE